MRTKDEILVIAQKRVTEASYKAGPAFWIEVKKLEVLIDIRDILKDSIGSADRVEIIKYKNI